MSDQKKAPPPPPTKTATPEETNLWQEMLEKSSSIGWGTAKVGASTLVCVGDRLNGKSSMLAKFTDRITDLKMESEFILDFSYLNAKNRFNLDRDEIVSRMKLWQLDDRAHGRLLTKLIRPEEIKDTAFMVTVDLSKPWELESSLAQWLVVLKELSASLLAQLSEAEQAQAKLRVSTHVQTFAGGVKQEAKAEDAAVPAEAESAETTTTTEEAEASPADGTAIDPAIPTTNLGFPLVIVGTKADFFARGLAKAGADDKFEQVVRRMRTTALEYGAALVFTSAFGEGENITTLQDYVYNRLLGVACDNPAKVVGTAEDATIFVPAGFDSADLIQALDTGKKTGWSDTTSLAEVFDHKDERKKDDGKEGMIEAEDNDAFFESLKNQLDKGVPYSAASEKGASAKKQMVNSFFNNLKKKA